MKAIASSAWLLCVALGNVLVAVISAMNLFSSTSQEYLTYTGLMIFAFFWFIYLAKDYVYTSPAQLERDLSSNSLMLAAQSSSEDEEEDDASAADERPIIRG